jgi:AraC family transcriptional regulator
MLAQTLRELRAAQLRCQTRWQPEIGDVLEQIPTRGVTGDQTRLRPERYECGQLSSLDWSEPGERLLSSSLAHGLISHALLNQVGRRAGLRLNGGLAPSLRRRVRDFIQANLAEPLSLGQLARLCALSEYHFARMFQLSFGLPPHRYVLAQRLLQAQRLLRSSPLPLGEVALACGFASASHFSNRFRQALGATPGQYRQAFAGR